MKSKAICGSTYLDTYGTDLTDKKYDLDFWEENPKGMSEMCKVMEDMLTQERREAMIDTAKRINETLTKVGNL